MGKQLMLFEETDGYMVEKPTQPDSENNELHEASHLEVYTGYSILMGEDNGVEAVWLEGKQSREAQNRYRQVMKALEDGYLENAIEEAKSPTVAAIFESKLLAAHKLALENIVSSISAQTGRALVEIFVLQLVVKAISAEQDVRLHKSSTAAGNFSWQEGISMRRLDDSFIGPTLRRHELVRMNQYGAFMTRSFAENYPYTPFYKAEISGAKQRWLELIAALQAGELDAQAALLYVLNLLWKTSEKFLQLVTDVLSQLNIWMHKRGQVSIRDVVNVVSTHIENSEARARLLEVAIHSFMQAEEELRVDLGGRLKPLMPMRTANLKHRNIGDVEVLLGDVVVEAWDAKYENPYLSDSLEELLEKIRGRNVSELVFGYVLMPIRKEYGDVNRKITEIQEAFGVKVEVLAFTEWVDKQLTRAFAEGVSEEKLARAWLLAYTESLGQRRRDKAPIDEPTFEWMQTLIEALA